MDQRVALLGDWLRGEWTMTELAARYQISRKTAYKWVARYAADRETGLLERSRAPTVHGRAHAPALRDPVLALRRQHPHWGPKKLRAVLAAAPDALRGALDAALGGGDGPERGVDGGFQRMVPDRRWHALRPLDGDRRVESLCVVLSDHGADPTGGAAVAGAPLSRVWRAPRAPHG